MKWMKQYLLGVLCVMVTLATTAQTAQPAKIEWNTWDQATAKMQKEPRKLMVDVYTD